MSKYGTVCHTAFEGDVGVGTIGFLSYRHGQDYDAMVLSDEPFQCTDTDTPRLNGFLGERNNVSRTAMGLGRIVFSDIGDYGMPEFRYVPVPDSKVRRALAALGYPELAA